MIRDNLQSDHRENFCEFVHPYVRYLYKKCLYNNRRVVCCRIDTFFKDILKTSKKLY